MISQKCDYFLHDEDVSCKITFSVHFLANRMVTKIKSLVIMKFYIILEHVIMHRQFN